MKRNVLAIIVVGLLVAADFPKDAATKKDFDALQGTWVLVSGERDGKKLSEETAKNTKLAVAGFKFLFVEGGEIGTASEGMFTLDATKKPKQTDSTATKGPDKGKVFLGIYDIEGDMHKVCFAPPGKERPKEFSSKEGSGHIFQVWKREKK